MSIPYPRRAVVALALAVLTLTAAAGPAIALVQQDYEVADGRTGGVEPGRENDDEQVFPINYTYRPTDHQPGASGAGFDVYASGLTENITGHWVVLESSDFDFSECAATDASVFGIDRGNDDSGTTTDESLLTAYKSYTSTQDGIYIEFAKESGLNGEPVKAYVVDQLVARQTNCVTNPAEPGWYRVNGHINGSTKHDTQTDYTIYAEAQYTYICDCDSRQDARETLGPPPTEESSDATATPEQTPTATAEPEPTATSEPDGTATSQPETTATTEPAETPTPTETSTVSTTAGTAATSTGTGTSSGTTSDSGTTGGTATGDSDPVAETASPSSSSGPGFGAAVALLALVGSTVVALRRKK